MPKTHSEKTFARFWDAFLPKTSPEKQTHLPQTTLYAKKYA
jgi:hypothetical protein